MPLLIYFISLRFNISNCLFFFWFWLRLLLRFCLGFRSFHLLRLLDRFHLSLHILLFLDVIVLIKFRLYYRLDCLG
jgi:hypothetical protein